MAKLEADLQETMAWDGEIFIKGQDSMKKELIRHFSTEDFSWIDNIFLDEEDEDGEGEEQAEEYPTNRVSTNTVIENNIIEIREESENVPPI